MSTTVYFRGIDWETGRWKTDNIIVFPNQPISLSILEGNHGYIDFLSRIKKIYHLSDSTSLAKFAMYEQNKYFEATPQGYNLLKKFVKERLLKDNTMDPLEAYYIDLLWNYKADGSEFIIPKCGVDQSINSTDIHFSRKVKPGDNVVVKQSEYGKLQEGLFANRKITKGTKIVEYSGIYITEDDQLNMFHNHDARYTIQVGESCMRICGLYKNDIAGKANSPYGITGKRANATFQECSEVVDNVLYNRVYIVAFQDINKDEEIFVSYTDFENEMYSEHYLDYLKIEDYTIKNFDFKENRANLIKEHKNLYDSIFDNNPQKVNV